ncbi:hypothetical protein FALBO_16954 [Fusarium albosuccineum]|uniref:Uncharacterized protein n=1 Tax=Fusarium albosuccineum TaxID=1237068 RepID=A0A8H4K9W7_9HYPO|nr:hypothetical protein FALBO_16954 [Fusarium albosuccineum]
MSSLVPSESVDSGWRHCVLKHVYSDLLYRYKKRPTPDGFFPNEKLLAFRIGYDLKSQTTQLELFPPSLGNDGPTSETMEFSDTKRHFQYASTDSICGWYLGDGDRAKNQWDTMRSVLERLGQDQLSHSTKFRNQFVGVQTSCHGIEPLWAIRGYFIGPDTASSPPYITVLCSNEHISRYLVDSIHKRRNLWEGWGVTRLPKLRLLQYGFGQDSSADPDLPDSEILATAEAAAERQLESIEVRVANDYLSPTMANENISS